MLERTIIIIYLQYSVHPCTRSGYWYSIAEVLHTSFTVHSLDHIIIVYTTSLVGNTKNRKECMGNIARFSCRSGINCFTDEPQQYKP